MRKLITTAMILLVGCVTTGWDKKDKDGVTNSCKIELSMHFPDEVCNVFCNCMVDKMEVDVPEFDKAKAKQWLNGEKGKVAGKACSEKVVKQFGRK